MAKDGLSEKQKLFCEEYLKDLNGTQALIRAGYSENGARQSASKLLSNSDIQDYVQKLMEKRAKKTGVTQDRVLNELAKIAFSDMKDYAKWSGESVELEDSAALKEGRSACILEVSQTSSVTGNNVKIKLHDKVRALEMLAKHLGLDQPKEDDGEYDFEFDHS